MTARGDREGLWLEQKRNLNRASVQLPACAALARVARRCLAYRAQRGPLGVLPEAKRPRGAFWSQRETMPGYLRLSCFGGKRREEPRSPATRLLSTFPSDRLFELLAWGSQATVQQIQFRIYLTVHCFVRAVLPKIVC